MEPIDSKKLLLTDNLWSNEPMSFLLVQRSWYDDWLSDHAKEPIKRGGRSVSDFWS